MRRLFAIVFLALTAASVLYDLLNGGRLRTVGEWWFSLHQNSLQLAEPAIARYLHPKLWDPGVVTVLLWPAAALLGGLGALFLVLGLLHRGR